MQKFVYQTTTTNTNKTLSGYIYIYIYKYQKHGVTIQVLLPVAYVVGVNYTQGNDPDQQSLLTCCKCPGPNLNSVLPNIFQ